MLRGSNKVTVVLRDGKKVERVLRRFGTHGKYINYNGEQIHIEYCNGEYVEAFRI